MMQFTFNRIFFAAGCAALFFMVLMGWQGRPLVMPETHRGILCLEFAKTTERVQQIKTAWQPVKRSAINNTLLDYFFIAAYTCFFITAMLLFIKCFVSGKQEWKVLALLLACTPGVLDAIENVFLLKWLQQDPAGSAEVLMVYRLVWSKFVLAGLLVIIALPLWVWNITLWLRRKKA
jgi:hypothetical protein